MMKSRHSRWSISFACALLWCILLVAFPLVSSIAAAKVGQSAWLAGFVAMLLSGVAGTLALVISSLRPPNVQGANYILFAMLVRMALPLLAVMVCYLTARYFVAAQGLLEGEFFGQLIIFYLLMLFSETLLALRVGPSEPATGEVVHHG
jgi:hypothetical protein